MYLDPSSRSCQPGRLLIPSGYTEFGAAYAFMSADLALLRRKRHHLPPVLPGCISGQWGNMELDPGLNTDLTVMTPMSEWQTPECVLFNCALVNPVG